MKYWLPMLLVLSLLAPAAAGVSCVRDMRTSCCCAGPAGHCAETGNHLVEAPTCHCGVTAPLASLPTLERVASRGGSDEGAPAAGDSIQTIVERVETAVSQLSVQAGVGSTPPPYIYVCSFIS